MDSYNKVGLIDKLAVDNLIKEGRIIVYYGNTILDVTDFKHPGPDTILQESRGKDIKQEFDDQGHSKFAKSLLSKFKIGNIKDNIYEELSIFTPEQQARYDEIDKKLDLKKAIVPQLAKLTKEEYLLLIDRPQYLETSDSLILYDDEWKDWWAKTDMTLNQRVIIPTSLLLLFYAIKCNEITFDNVIFCLQFFLLGVAAWTLMEYKEHRFSLHAFHQIPEKITEENIDSFFFTHHVHHMFANQEYRIVIPLFHVAKVCAPGLILGWYFLGPEATCGFYSGLLLAYIWYDTMHFWFHFGGDFKIKWFQELKEKHMRHHYREKTKDYGVTSNFWDYVFDTI